MKRPIGYRPLREKELRLLIELCICSFDPVLQVSFRLLIYDNLPPGKLAKTLKLTRANFRVMIFRARRMLRKKVLQAA